LLAAGAPSPHDRRTHGLPRRRRGADGRAVTSTLVIHPGALGDVLQAVPALRALRADGPLTFAGQSRFGGLFRGLGLVDAALSFDGLGVSALFTREPLPAALEERLARFDRVISWFGARDRTYRERLGAAARDVVIASPVPGDESRAPVWRHLLAASGATSPLDLSPLDVPPAWREEAGRALGQLGVAPGQPLLVVHPGAGAAWKRWPVEQLAHVIGRARRETATRALIHQGPADRDAADQLTRALAEPALLLVEPDLPLLAGVLGQATAYLGGDSGVSHLAAAVGAPAMILFPAATRERWAPWSPTATALAAEAGPDQAQRVAVTVSAALRAAAYFCFAMMSPLILS
jgi:lipopolysaccharide heptosyltransferase III